MHFALCLHYTALTLVSASEAPSQSTEHLIGLHTCTFLWPDASENRSLHTSINMCTSFQQVSKVYNIHSITSLNVFPEVCLKKTGK